MYRIGKKFFFRLHSSYIIRQFLLRIQLWFSFSYTAKKSSSIRCFFFFHENGISVEGAFHRYMINKAKLPNNLWSKIQNM